MTEELDVNQTKLIKMTRDNLKGRFELQSSYEKVDILFNLLILERIRINDIKTTLVKMQMIEIEKLMIEFINNKLGLNNIIVEK